MTGAVGSGAGLGQGENPDKLAADLIVAARSGQGAKLLPRAQQMLSQHPKHLGIIQGMVEVCTSMGDFVSAEKHAETMVEIAPQQPMTHLAHASCLMKLNANKRAFQALALAEARTSNNPNVLSIIAQYYEKLDAMSDALRVLQRLSAVEPNDGNHQQRIAAVHRFLGNLDAAEEYCNLAIANKLDDYHVYFLRSGLRKQTRENNHVEKMETLLAQGVTGHRNRVHLQYALAKEYEDLGEADTSFRHLKEVSDIQRKEMDYDVSLDLRTMDEIKHNFDRAYFQRVKPGHPAADPIFIIGMPRTGTTLVERIVGSHSQVHSLGEMGMFARLMVRAVKTMYGSQDVPPGERVKLTSKLDYAAIGEKYLAGVADRRNGKPFFIDKLPYNYLNVGPIHASLPNAKIIQLDRHPMDTCYAIYKTLFGLAYPFSYSMEDLGRYYAGYRKLLDHWHAVLPPGRVLTVKYEDVVADQEGQTRRIFKYCGLEWEEQVKEFHKSQQSSTTASASQVRQPIYKSSVAKWRQFERHLAPLRAVLEANGIKGFD